MRRYLLIGAFYVAWAVMSDVLAQPEGAMGDFADMPAVVGMTQACPGFTLARGTLTAAEHEIQDGSFSLQNLDRPVLSVLMPPGAVALLRAREFNGQDVEIVVMPIKPRVPQKVER